MIATIPALARSPRKMNRTAITRPMPTSRLCSTLCVVTWTRSVRWLKTLMLHPLGQELLVLDLLDLLRHRLGGRQRFFVLPHQDDAFDDIVFRLSRPADDAPAGADARRSPGQSGGRRSACPGLA